MTNSDVLRLTEPRSNQSNHPSPGIDWMVIQHYCLGMASVSQIQANLRAAMKDALRIQDRFVPEPVFAKTGRGHLKSEGVATLHKIKTSVRHRSSAKTR